MKLCFVVHRYAPFPGGSEYYVQQMAEEALSRGHDVTVLAGEHRGSLNGVKVNSEVGSLINKDLIGNILWFLILFLLLFNSPNDITIDAAGNFYVANFGTNTVSKIDTLLQRKKQAAGSRKRKSRKLNKKKSKSRYLSKWW